MYVLLFNVASLLKDVIILDDYVEYIKWPKREFISLVFPSTFTNKDKMIWILLLAQLFYN